jgi:hypothetical protein
MKEMGKMAENTDRDEETERKLEEKGYKLKKSVYDIPTTDLIVREGPRGKYIEPRDFRFDEHGRVVLKRVDDWGNRY